MRDGEATLRAVHNYNLVVVIPDVPASGTSRVSLPDVIWRLEASQGGWPDSIYWRDHNKIRQDTQDRAIFWHIDGP